MFVEADDYINMKLRTDVWFNTVRIHSYSILDWMESWLELGLVVNSTIT